MTLDIDALVDHIGLDLLREQDVRLLKMTLAEHPTQKELDDFLSTWDLEVEGASKSLMMSYFQKAHPELKFPEYFGPRLKGLLNYYRFHNLKLIASFKKICSELFSHGITVTILKGGAMKVLRPELSRKMNDIDILVEEKDYRKAGRIISRMGYDISWDQHSFDVHFNGTGDGLLDVHKFIPMFTGKEKTIMGDVLRRTRGVDLFGVPGRILSKEDLVFSLLVNLSRNIMNDTCTDAILFTFIDVKYLIDSETDFNWDVIAENAKRSGAEGILSFAVHFINSVVPSLISETFKMTSRQEADIVTIAYYRRYILCPLQKESHKLGVTTVLKSPRLIPAFLRIRPKYTFLKLFRTHPKAARQVIGLADRNFI